MPTQLDREVFRALIEKPGHTANHKDDKITHVYQYFRHKIAQKIVSLDELTKVVTTRLSVVSIVLEHDDNPHLVFESLNAKGRPLTQADLIRNYFFMRIHPNDQEEIYRQYWEPMQLALGDNLTECIRHYLMRGGAIVKQGDVYFTLKDRVGADPGDALQALQEIATFAGYYQRLLFPVHEPNIELQRSLLRLVRLEVTTAYPFLLNCYHDYAQSRITDKELLQIFKIIENYIIRRFVCNIATSQLNKIFPPLYKQAQQKAHARFVDSVQEVLQARGYPKDNEFKSRLQDTRLYGSSERLIKTRLILQGLEEAYGHKEAASLENTSVEHIMPQTLTPAWQAHLGESAAEDHELLLHVIGNLTLTGYNPELSNKPYSEKKKRYLNSNIQLNNYFADVEIWDKTAIEARSAVLADLALAVWPYFGTGNNVSASADEVTGKKPKALIILEQNYTVDSWRDVLEATLNTIAELEPDGFEQLIKEYPRFISNNPAKFKQNRQLNNGYFIECRISARETYRFCTQIIETVGLSADDWTVLVDDGE
jgi:hypothetical protein